LEPLGSGGVVVGCGGFGKRGWVRELVDGEGEREREREIGWSGIVDEGGCGKRGVGEVCKDKDREPVPKGNRIWDSREGVKGRLGGFSIVGYPIGSYSSHIHS
jgi:hypothetical protein